MKKNELATFLVYLLMFGIAFLVGWYVVRPILMSNTIPNYIAVVIVGLIVGVALNGILLELGHILGAKTGKYRILSVCIFGFTWSRKENGKIGVKFASYEGLTGQTKIVPESAEESNPSGYIGFPLLFLFLEFVISMIAAITASNDMSNLGWLCISSYIVIAVAGMVFLYDFFPAHLDSITDGYLLMLTGRPANRLAYNHLLLAREAKESGKEPYVLPVFEEVTDFTAALNLHVVYRLAQARELDKALALIQKTLDAEYGVSKATKLQAKSLRLSLLLNQAMIKGKKEYEEWEDEDKRYLASLSNMTSLRCYLLIASCVEHSETETNYAIDKVEKILKNEDEDFRDEEKALLIQDIEAVKANHPTWKLYPLPWEEKQD